MTEPTTDPVEAVVEAMWRSHAAANDLDTAWANLDQPNQELWRGYARAMLGTLTALGAVMPDEAAKLRAGQCDALCRDVEQDRDMLRAAVDDVLALCQPTRGDTLAGVSAEDRLRQIEARLTREAVQSHEEASK